MGTVLGSLKPEILWNHFESICSYPHPSHKEEKLAEYIVSVGKKNNLETLRDEYGNILIRKPATKGYEGLKTVVLQGHIDMVCEKNSDVELDFDNDPIEVYADNGWVKAKGTTLGSDNGVGVAAALAILDSNDIEHGPIECLFTLAEETGLFGAAALQPDWLKAEILLNLDSEEDGHLYIGCAGGKNSYTKYKYEKGVLPSGSAAFNLKVSGLKGGHSGLEIHSGRGNAIKIMNRLLFNLTEKYAVAISCFDAGSKHNAIPRESFATIVVADNKKAEAVDFVSKFNETIKAELATNEPGLKVEIIPADLPAYVLSENAQKGLLLSLYAVPHGVLAMSPDIAGLVETSTNLAVIKTEDEYINVITSQRSSVESAKDDAVAMVRAAFILGGAEVECGDGYPGWKPNVKSPILSVVKDVYQKLYGQEPEVKAIHAGLECGIIVEKYPDMDMISFGPTILGAHSPEEKVDVETVGKFWALLKSVLVNIPKK